MCRRKSLPEPHQSIPRVGALFLEEPVLSFSFREGPCISPCKDTHPAHLCPPEMVQALVSPKRRMNGAQGKSLVKMEISTGLSRYQDALWELPECEVAIESSDEAVSSKKHCLPFPRGTRSLLVRPPCREGTQWTVCSWRHQDVDGGKESQNNWLQFPFQWSSETASSGKPSLVCGLAWAGHLWAPKAVNSQKKKKRLWTLFHSSINVYSAPIMSQALS